MKEEALGTEGSQRGQCEVDQTRRGPLPSVSAPLTSILSSLLPRGPPRPCLCPPEARLGPACPSPRL